MKAKVLGNRYELIEKIGGGGMAVVYKARCRLLNRFVAIKILRDEFISDGEFLRRFEMEAQAAASLSHPNIVPVYDVGSEDNLFYIVMELVEGMTLKEQIEKEGRFEWRRALRIAGQICSALSHAHGNQIIHRDIKPHNILMTKGNVAKVTDFGIARAISSSTVTSVGTAIGSVHYFSPEQARGGYTDEKSDLYSLGIVLYEMITGKLPFDGDTLVSVAMMHIHDEAVMPNELAQDIPESANALIMKAIRKEQFSRYGSAQMMLDDINRILMDPDTPIADRTGKGEMDETRKIETVEMDYMNGFDDREEDEAQEEMPEKKGRQKKDKLSIVLAALISIALIGAFAYIGYSVFFRALNVETNRFVVKNYVGRYFYEIAGELEAANIEIIEQWHFNDEVERDEVYRQSVEPGFEFKLDGYNSIELHISKGPEVIEIPFLAGKELREAEIDISQIGLIMKVVEENSEIIPEGHIIGTYPPAGDSIKPETEIIVYLSLGPLLRIVNTPDVTGNDYIQAKKLLEYENLVVGNIIPDNVDLTLGRVKAQDPEPEEEVEEGSAVDLYFSQDKYFSLPVYLSEKAIYGDFVNLEVFVTPSDTNITDTKISSNIIKNQFPVVVDAIPVPINERVNIRVILDGIVYIDMEVEWEDL